MAKTRQKTAEKARVERSADGEKSAASSTARSGWRKVKLGGVIDPVLGGTPSRAVQNYWNGNIKWISIQDIISASGRYIRNTAETISEEGGRHSPAKILPKDSIIISARGTVGALGMLAEPMAFNQSCYGLVLKNPKEIDQIYFFYALQDIVRRAKKMAHGGVFDTFTKDTFNHIDFEYPEDIDTQKCIAEILSAFDDKIELNNKTCRMMEQMAQWIFKEWLLKSQKEKGREQRLSGSVKIISGHPFSSKLYVNDKKAIGVVTIKNVQDGNFITNCDSFIREESVPKNMNQECLLHDGDILLSLTGNVGRACFVYGGKYLLNQRVAKLEPKNEKDHAFCYFLFRQTSMQNQLINMAKGSAQPNLSPVETGEIELAIPPREGLDKFSELVGPIYERLIKNAIENQKLAALRDLLLPKLMSGELVPTVSV